MAAKAKKNNFEQSFSKLSDIVDQLEDENTTLDEAIALYKDGVDLAVELNEKLSVVEKEVAVLKEKSNGIFELKKFDTSSLEGDYIE